ncbi:Methionine adenosyltransferase 2 subunit beta [Physocladia obscura]|uniref:Methionine adenosyltransferase 2 subunit beta n=1 Tax=Physocladia obscura TaxID=109957 RepID=A0AAD5X9X1_9FUNG|nr:Methionine adenosyltransferase 2 subunit beta [Physocladia obscura]
MQTQQPTVVVTGASGLLGRAVYKALIATNKYNVVGTKFSRQNDTYVKLDITNRAELHTFFDFYRPAAVIHCAAERRPDVAEKNKAAAHLINVTAAGWTADECHIIGAWFCYISTDYVFDGKNPPYETDSVPNPLNYYGLVPLLYGYVEFDEESAVNCLVPIVKNSAKKVLMDDFQIRYPTNCDDAASALIRLVSQSISKKSISGVYHFCGKDKMTKYEMCVVIAGALGISIEHLEPLRDFPTSALAARPYNAELSNSRIEDEARIRVSCTPFFVWWTQYLKKIN